MERESIQVRISELLVEEYGVAEKNLVINLTELFCEQLSSSIIGVNMQAIEEQRKIQLKRDDYEARKIALDTAAKTYGQTGGDLTENAIKYKRFLLNETVNEN